MADGLGDTAASLLASTREHPTALRGVPPPQLCREFPLQAGARSQLRTGLGQASSSAVCCFPNSRPGFTQEYSLTKSLAQNSPSQVLLLWNLIPARVKEGKPNPQLFVLHGAIKSVVIPFHSQLVPLAHFSLSLLSSIRTSICI